MKRCHQKFATWKVPRSIIRSNSYFWISHWKYVHKGQQKTTGVSTCTTIHGSIKKKKKKKKLMNAFLNSQFSYCRPLYGCVNRFHERCLRLIYNDKQLTFEEPLQKDGSISIHIRNLQALAIEMCTKPWMAVILKLWRRCSEFVKKTDTTWDTKNLQTSYSKFSLQRRRNSFVFGA